MSFDPKEHLELLAHDCEKCAQQYTEKPGLVQPATIVDLYQAIARLARILKASR